MLFCTYHVAGQARNFYFNSTDDVRIGAWHILPESIYETYAQHASEKTPELPVEIFEQALQSHPTFVYLHGNAMNRAAPFRIRTYKDLVHQMNANVIAIDYRGFGDSQSFPTEEGVINDAYAAIQFVRDHAVNPKTGKSPGLTLMGQSLGTGVASQCALRLHREGIHLDALVLLAPFKSIHPMVAEFRMGGVVPLLGFLDLFPGKDELIQSLLQYKFDTMSALKELVESSTKPDALTAPTILVMHAENDEVIPVYHAEDLYMMAEDTTHAMVKSSPFLVWGSNAPDLGYVRSIMHKSARLPERRGLLPGARFVLPRSAIFTYVRLEKGGHNHLLDYNVDAMQLMLPQYMTGPGATTSSAK